MTSLTTTAEATTTDPGEQVTAAAFFTILNTRASALEQRNTGADLDAASVKEMIKSIQELQAKDIMTVNPKSIGVDDYATAAFVLMKTHNITQLVVLDGKKIAGFVHIHDLMKEGIV